MVSSLLLLLTLALFLLQGVGTSFIRLDENGYEGVVIAIDPDMPEDEKLIREIKNMISDASVYLYEATKQRFYFKRVSILIPMTWQGRSDYENARLETYKHADIIIEVPNPPGNDAPRTDHFGKCGEKGERIHLTPDVVLGEKVNEYGQPGKILVHEWAHFRWGVFEEYNDAQRFYKSNGENVPVRCSEDITGQYRVYACAGGSCAVRLCRTERKTGKFDKDCLFIPNKLQNTRASIMFMPSIDSVVEFCTERNHNREAPNSQNNKCNLRSTWEVIQYSDDYKTTTPMRASKPPRPKISLRKIRERILCLVLDKSKSMGSSNRLTRLNQATKFFMLQIIEKGSWAGVVTFDSTAYVQRDLIYIETNDDRNILTAKLPTYASGDVSICSGLRSAFKVIRKRFSTAGAEIVLLSDGEDDEIKKCYDEVRESGAIIHTLALGPSADAALEVISQMTGGLCLTSTDNAQNNGLIDAFSAFSSGNGIFTQRVIQLESKGAVLKNGEWMNGTVIIDMTIGNDTLFLVTWTVQQPRIFVTDPSGKRYKTFLVDKYSKMAYLRIPNTATVGRWSYNIRSSAQTLTVTVTSRAANSAIHPITVDSKMSRGKGSFPNPMTVYAEVRQGTLPILGANVIAFIESAKGLSFALELLDNGAGADAYKNDGVYSRYFTAYKTDGRYSLKVRVRGGKNSQRSKSQGNAALYIPGWIEYGEIKMNPSKSQIDQDVIQEDIPCFIRTATGGSFIMSDVPECPIPDRFPPNKIMDLEANFENEDISMTWTAPGDDYDMGKAQRYIIRMSKDIRTLREYFDLSVQVNTIDLIPSEANFKEVFVFHPGNLIIENDTTVFLAIKAVDKVNLVSPLSNIARATLFIPPPQKSYNPAPVNVTTIVLAVLGTLVIIIAIVIAIVCILKKKAK